MFYSAQSQTIVECVIAPFRLGADLNSVWTELTTLKREERGACLDYARANGLLWLYAMRLNELGFLASCPIDEYLILNQALEEGNRAWTQQEQEMLEVVLSLRRAGVASLVLKGPALTYLLYARRGVRPVRDLDLLIHATDARQAITVLESLRFSGASRGTQPDHHLPRMFRSRIDGTILSVELHSRLIPRRIYGIRINALEGLWERSIWLATGKDGGFQTLSPGDHVLHLHMHLFHHIFYNFRLMHLVDIVFAWRVWREILDWSALADALARLGLLQFRKDLWFWITKHFGDVMPAMGVETEDQLAIGNWLLQHGSLPIRVAPRYSKSVTECIVSSVGEIRRYLYRSFLAPGWGYQRIFGK